MGDGSPVRRDDAPQVRQQVGRNLTAGGRRRDRAAERRAAGARDVLVHEPAHLIDRRDARLVALALGRSPREQAVPAEQDAVAAFRLVDRLPQHQRQLEARALPRDPCHAPAEPVVELRELHPAVGAGRQRDRPVGVQVVDVRKRQERVQRRVDRGGDPVLAEGAERVQADHLVLVRFAAVAGDEALEPVHVQHGEARGPDRSQVAAAALHRHHARGCAGQRIGQLELRTGVAAAEVGDAQVGAQEVRTIAQQVQRTRGQPVGLCVVPQIGEVAKIRHVSTPRRRGTGGSAGSTYRSRQARTAPPETSA